jgi:glycosyltransferase involved in cell wall biosynthesis
MKKEKFCEVTPYWDKTRMHNQIVPYPARYLAEMMLEKKFDVEILTRPLPRADKSMFEIDGGIKVRRFPKNRTKFCIDLFRHMLKNDYSLIHLHSLGFFEEYATWLASKAKGAPMVFTHHDSQLPETLSNISVKSLLFRGGLKVMDSETSVFVAFTNFQANLYRRSCRIKNITVIPHGIDSKVFDVKKNPDLIEKYLGENNILCVGYIVPRKGQDILIESMPQILRAHPRTKLLLAGWGSETFYLETLEKKIDKLGLRDNVLFLKASRDELIQLYLCSDVFALPTDAELFPHVFLEAAAARLPIITTDRPYTREILKEGKAGLLVEREQTEFENGIINMLDDKILRNRLIENARRMVEKEYSLRRVIEKHWALYDSLMR